MKILMLFPYAPLPPPFDLAGTKRNLPFLLELAKQNEVTVLSFGTEAQEQLFLSRYGSVVAGASFVAPGRTRWQSGLARMWLLATGRSPYRLLYRSEMQVAIDRITSSRSFDLIHCCVPMFGYYRFPDGMKRTTDTHEVKFDLNRRIAECETSPIVRAYHRHSYRLGRIDEPSLWASFDAVIATTEKDRERMVAVSPSLRPYVVPNGAGDEFFRHSGSVAEPGAMVFTGLFTHPPNVQAMEFFLDRIFPQVLARVPHARIYVVGKDPPRRLVARSSSNVIVTGFVEDVRPYLEQSEVFVIPLLSGGGIRGKALEAMAMGKAIVSTTIGVEGIALRDRESALFGDTAETFADAVVELLRCRALREQLGNGALAVALQQYTWASRGRQLNGVLSEVVAGRASLPD